MNYGLIGKKLGHSFSKEIHEKIGDYEYEICEIPEDKLCGFIRGREYKGLNVTIPYKQSVIPLLDEVSDAAQKLGAVNTIVNRGGHLFGDNTDYAGMKALINRLKIDAAGKKVLILGSGGTSKTAFGLVTDMGAGEIYQVSRSPKNERQISYDVAYTCHSDADIIINTTPSGMFPNNEGMPIDLDKFDSLCGVVDAVYNPLRTNLVLAAQKKGIPAEGGLYMLVAQAVYANGLFMQKEVKTQLIDKIYGELLNKKRNIVLTGMPGAGKTTVGKIIAQRPGRKFVDTDEQIKTETGMTPAQIINEQGEEAFRQVEAGIIAELSQENRLVIATGGGAVLREENVRRLSQNGIIIFIDRDIDSLVPTPDRPLSMDREQLKRRFDERYPIYVSTADVVAKAQQGAHKTAEHILERMI